MSQIKVKSKAGNPKAYVWLMLDVGGKLQAVCYEAPSARVAMGVPFMLQAAKQAIGAFRRAAGPSQVSSSALVDLGGRPLALPPQA